MRRPLLLCIALVIALNSAASAQTTQLSPELSGLTFLVGHWDSGDGKVVETGGTSRGSSSITSEVGGAVLLRRDHAELFGADGKAAGGFDILMMIYPEGGTLHADYSDGEHIIHYASAVVVPGRSVVFRTAPGPAAPSFRLTYQSVDANTLAVLFEIAPPGQATYRTIAKGTLHKANS